MVGILDYGLAKVADLMIKYVITPAVKSGSKISVFEEINQDSEHITEMVLKIDRPSDIEVNFQFCDSNRPIFCLNLFAGCISVSTIAIGCREKFTVQYFLKCRFDSCPGTKHFIIYRVAMYEV